MFFVLLTKLYNFFQHKKKGNCDCVKKCDLCKFVATTLKGLMNHMRTHVKSSSQVSLGIVKLFSYIFQNIFYEEAFFTLKTFKFKPEPMKENLVSNQLFDLSLSKIITKLIASTTFI